MGDGMRFADGYIAVDWGTSNRRGYRVDSSGKRVDEFEDSKGVLTISANGFPEAVAEIRARLGDLPMLLAGMIGSNRGWVKAAYVPCPAGIEDLAAKVVWADERSAIVPGVSFIGQGRADIMRGEEVQLLGAVAAGLVGPEGFVCHPGTHNKWALLRHGKIHIFGTVMTGELFNLLKEHSILADLLQTPVDANDAFKRGVRRAMEREMLAADLFGVRAGVLLGEADKGDASSYVSGLLIGADVRIGLTWPAAAQISVIGRPELTRLYAAAISEANRDALEIDGEQCFLAGIQEIAKRI